MRHWLKNAGIFARVYLVLTAVAFSFQPALANSADSPFVASYFQAAEKENTPDFNTNMVTAPGSPLSIRVNKDPVTKGNYAGVEITTPIPDTNFQNVSFLLTGAETTQVIVHSQARDSRILTFKGIAASAGMKTGKTEGSYRRVSLDAAQFGIAPGDAVDKIVISTNENVSQSSFTIKDVRIDGKLVNKSVQTGALFYPVVNGKPSGPKAGFAQLVQGLPTTAMTVSLLNSTGAQQYFYINVLRPSKTTPGYPTSEEVKNLNSVQTTVTGPNTQSGEGSITAVTPRHGYFFLNQGDTVSFTTSPANLTFSAQIFTNGTNPNSSVWPDSSQCITNVNAANQPVQGAGRGATFAEFTINGDTTYLLPDAADISEVNGVNAIYKITFPTVPNHAASTNYPDFFCTSNYLFSRKTVAYGVIFAKGQYIPVQSIQNRPGTNFTGDASATLSPISPAINVPGGTPYFHGTVGVYPFGCDLCTGSSVPGCPPYPTTSPQKYAICQVARPVANLGGVMQIELKTFPYP